MKRWLVRCVRERRVSYRWLCLLGGVVLFHVISSGFAFSATWSNTYDVMDRLSGRTDPLGRSESYAYDLNGNLTRFTDRKGQITTFAYDPLSRLTGMSYADGSTTTVSYDSVGRPVALTDSIGGRIDLAYDALNRVVKEVTAQGAISYTYDVLGRRTSMTAGGQQPVTYAYDAASHLTQVAQGGLTVTMAYDAAGRRTTITYSNGTTTTSSYDNASRLTGTTHVGPSGIIEALTYQYDAAGNRTSLTRNNGTASLLPPAVTSATYDAANEQLSLNPSTPNETYDANGNLTSRTDGTVVTTYTWDARNRLTTINSPTLTASFVYDALNRRISKTVNGVNTQYLYDRKDIVQEIRNGAVTVNYVRSLSIDEPFARVGSVTEFYHRDALGTTLLLTDETGAAKTTYIYAPFGETTVTGTPSTNPFQYAGRENDGTGLYYYRMRYYSPLMHRFILEDPIGLTGGINMYAYVSNSPINYRDPDGLVLENLFSGPLDAHSGSAVTANQFVTYVGGQSLNDVLHAADRSLRSDRSAGGPMDAFRYVVDPANPNAIIDMRHFLVVGQQGEAIGLGIEIFQALGGDRSSAFDPQDFFSNALGSQFFSSYDPSKPLSPQLRAFFSNRQKLAGRKP
jgi:RHS repeat-associated protein